MLFATVSSGRLPSADEGDGGKVSKKRNKTIDSEETTSMLHIITKLEIRYYNEALAQAAKTLKYTADYLNPGVRKHTFIEASDIVLSLRKF